MKTKKQVKYQRTKLAAIPGLCCVLAYVLLNPSQSEEVSSPASVATTPGVPYPAAQAPSSQDTSSQATQPTPVTSHQPWPEIELNFLTQSNPLASHRSSLAADRTEHFTSATVKEIAASHPAVDSLQNLAHDLNGSQINYVFKSRHRKAVMLGNQVFEQGEQLSDSVHLHDIQDHALILMETLKPQPLNGYPRSLSELLSRCGQLLRKYSQAIPLKFDAMPTNPVSAAPSQSRNID